MGRAVPQLSRRQPGASHDPLLRIGSYGGSIVSCTDRASASMHRTYAAAGSEADPSDCLIDRCGRVALHRKFSCVWTLDARRDRLALGSGPLPVVSVHKPLSFITKEKERRGGDWVYRVVLEREKLTAERSCVCRSTDGISHGHGKHTSHLDR